jgi:hypothetical protein
VTDLRHGFYRRGSQEKKLLRRLEVLLLPAHSNGCGLGFFANLDGCIIVKVGRRKLTNVSEPTAVTHSRRARVYIA